MHAVIGGKFVCSKYSPITALWIIWTFKISTKQSSVIGGKFVRSNFPPITNLGFPCCHLTQSTQCIWFIMETPENLSIFNLKKKLKLFPYTVEKNDRLKTVVTALL